MIRITPSQSRELAAATEKHGSLRLYGLRPNGLIGVRTDKKALGALRRNGRWEK